jgi:hypothetical protein
MKMEQGEVNHKKRLKGGKDKPEAEEAEKEGNVFATHKTQESSPLLSSYKIIHYRYRYRYQPLLRYYYHQE